MTIAESTHQALELLRSGQLRIFANKAIGRVYKEWLAYGLRRDLSLPLEPPRAKIPISVRELTPDDVKAFIPSDTSQLPIAQIRDLRVRSEMLAARIGRCYVAIDELKNKPCYMQWLIASNENTRIAELFQNRFPPLKPDEALLEGAYMLPEYRGLKIMPEATAYIAECGKHMGARFVNTFVDDDNIPSLKGCAHAGFKPYLIRRDRVLLSGRARRVTFEPFTGRATWLEDTKIRDSSTLTPILEHRHYE